MQGEPLPEREGTLLWRVPLLNIGGDDHRAHPLPFPPYKLFYSMSMRKSTAFNGTCSQLNVYRIPALASQILTFDKGFLM